MAQKAQNATTFSRLGLGLGFRSRQQEDWYIPYNGPYEVPKAVVRTPSRDSWGDMRDPDMVRARQQDQYGEGGRNFEYGGWTTEGDPVKERKSRLRDPLMSNLSSISSAATSPMSPMSSNRRSGYSTVPFSPTSWVSGGGIGESPVPPVRMVGNPPHGANWVNLAHFLPFSGTPRKVSPATPIGSSLPDVASDRRHTTSLSETPTTAAQHPTAMLDTDGKPNDPQSSPTPDEQSHDSFYSSPLGPSTAEASAHPHNQLDAKPSPAFRPTDQTRGMLQDSPLRGSPSHAASSSNPDTYPFPVSAPPFRSHATPPEAMSTAPVPPPKNVLGPDIASSDETHLQPPATSSEDKHNPPPNTKPPLPTSPKPLRPSLLKPSVSVPNLRSKRSVSPRLPQGVDRWLAAETWCDALIFPRPRFRMQQGNDAPINRIVSPPNSVYRLSVDDADKIASTRVPPKEEVNAPNPISLKQGKAPQRRRNVTLPAKLVKAPPGGKANQKRSSFAKDDLSLPSPVSSLNRVRREGILLDQQRKAWQRQASQSFQNKRSRSLSRTRSKSLTRPRANSQLKTGNDERPLGSIDFLAARSVLGNQGLAPDVHLRSERGRGGPFLFGGPFPNAQSRPLHSRGGSKSSSGKTHSRTSSWSKSALRLAKVSPLSAICGSHNDMLSPPADGAGALERAIKSGTTKRVRLGEPLQTEQTDVDACSPTPICSSTAHNFMDVPESSARITPSPSGENVGVALSPEPNLPRVQIPDHPYGMGSVESDKTHTEGDQRLLSVQAEYAGPHRSSTPMINNVPPLNDVSTRHRLPPHAMRHPHAILHPPAQAPQQQILSSGSNEPDIKAKSRDDSLIPPNEKLWIPGNQGELLEVLPEEIRYSPYIPPPPVVTTFPSHAYILPDKNRHTKLGMDEVLSSVLDDDSSRQEDGLSHLMKAQNEGSDTKRSPVNQRGDLQMPISPHSSGSPHIRRKRGKDDTSKRHPYSAATLPSSEALPSPSSPPGKTAEETSSGSSPQHASPWPMGIVDDLDRFRDLFYKPNQPHAAKAGSSSRDVPWDVGSSRTTSGLTTLARQLSEELEGLYGRPDFFNPNEVPTGRTSPFRGRPSTATSTELRFILTEMSRSRPESPPHGDALPYLFPDEPTRPADNVPDDVQSSRTSSLLEPEPDDQEGMDLFRLGAVEAVATPPAIQASHRISEHLSFVDVDLRQRNEEYRGGAAHSRLLSPRSALASFASDQARQSSVTSDTFTSHMSGLSDFPVPPEGSTPNRMSIVNLYADRATPRHSQETGNDPQTVASSNAGRVARRMTFGQDEGDADNILGSFSENV